MKIKQKILKYTESSGFRRLTFFIGIGVLILAGLIAVKPEPYLKFGYPGVFIFNAIGGSTIIFFSLVRHFDPILLSFITALGVAVNDSIAWVVGNSGTAVIKKPEKAKKIEMSIKKFGIYAIFFWSFIPFPYDLVGFVAGYLGMPYKSYIAATFLGKFIRFIIIGAWIIWFWY